MPSLRITRGPEAGKTYELTQPEVLVGSGIRNDVIIADGDVSPKHCRLVHEGNNYKLYDLGSKRGTFVAGKLVMADGVLLRSRIIIELGEMVAFEYIPGEETQRMGNVPNTRSTAELTHQMTYYLVIKRTSEPQPEIYALDMPTVKIGRDLENDIVLPEPKVSRHHIRLERVNKGYIVHDLKTSNGTFVNRHRIQLPTLLQTGDFVAIADAVEMWYTDSIDSLKM